MPASRPPRAGHEVDRARRHRRRRSSAASRGRQARLLLRLLPRVPQGGLGGRRTSWTPTASSSATTATGPATPSSSSTRRSRRRCVRTDIASAEMVKLASNAFLATKISFINEIANVCEETGADVDRGRPRHGPRRPHRPGVPAGRDRLRRLVLPQGRHRAQAARRQLRLPLPAAQRRHRGQRAAEAARDRQAPEAPRLARAASASRCSAWPSSPTPTTCARPSSLVLAARLQADGARVPAYDPVAEHEARAPAYRAWTSRRLALDAVEDADAVVLVTEWAEFARARLGRGGRARCAATCSSTAATSSIPRPWRDAGLDVRGRRPQRHGRSRPSRTTR